MDQDDVFASTPTLVTLRVLLLMTLSRCWTATTCDISTAFLHAPMTKRIAPLEPVGLWEPNDPPDADRPQLEICQDNWKSANQDPATTRRLIQQEKDAGFIEEISIVSLKLNVVGQKALPWEKWGLFVQTTETLDLYLIPRSVE